MQTHLDRAHESFRALFDGAEPTFCVAAPGRINLIGEHTDYNGFPVMPIALERAIHVLATPSHDGLVVLGNCEPDAYGRREFPVSAQIEPYDAGDWGNYAKAAVQSLVRRHGEQAGRIDALHGMRCMVCGSIPPACGLSSSSALVVAHALAFLACNTPECGAWASREERSALAELTAIGERYVGTQGGGMDQAVCLLATAGRALKIDFYPLRARTIPFPPDHVIVAAHSTVRAPKAASKRVAFNRRVIECTVGKELLARRLGRPAPPTLADLRRPADGSTPQGLLETLCEITGGRENLSVQQAAKLLGMSADRFAGAFLRMKDGSAIPVGREGLKVLPRCRHVLTEGPRVERAAELLAAGDAAGLGELMDESHRSGALDYEISTPELDALTGIMREGGALGARLTGAGFGGFAIALIGRRAAPKLLGRIERDFYQARGVPSEGNLHLFSPAAGASVIDLRAKH